MPGLQEFPLVSLPYSDRYEYIWVSLWQGDLRDAEVYPSQNMKTTLITSSVCPKGSPVDE